MFIQNTKHLSVDKYHADILQYWYAITFSVSEQSVLTRPHILPFETPRMFQHSSLTSHVIQWRTWTSFKSFRQKRSTYHVHRIIILKSPTDLASNQRIFQG
jgi:hypothetical protein